MDILVEAQDGSLWAAAVEAGSLTGLELDPMGEEVRWGSIYRAKVTRIDAARGVAFVDLDTENTGILHAADVRIVNRNGVSRNVEGQPIGKILTPGQIVTVQAKAGYLPRLEPENENIDPERKTTRVSMDIGLQGRYIIAAPFERLNRISRRVREKSARTRMEKMLDMLDDFQGCILRASAIHTQTDVLIREARILKAVWGQIQPHLAGDTPQLVMRGPDAAQRLLADSAGGNIEEIAVSSMEAYRAVEEWCDLYAPDLVTRIAPVEMKNVHGDLPLFAARDVIGQIESLIHPYVLLPGGGTILIEPTAALVAIDVNTGGDRRAHAEINAEAAKEIARQLRLRNLGGIAVVDFLKLKTAKERTALEKTLCAAFDADPCTVQIHGLTGLGLMELTRARRTPPLQDRLETVFGEEV